MNIAFECLFGSHLYGTATENSDTDYLGVFIPSREEILLQRCPDVIRDNTSDNSRKNTKDDIDREYYSLQKFVDLLCHNDIRAFDMLHANQKCTLKTSDAFQWLYDNRRMFYTKQLAERYREYCQKQAKKYGIKGSAIDIIKQCISILENANPFARSLHDIASELSSVQGVVDMDNFFVINQKRFHKTCRIDYVLSLLQGTLERMTANSDDGINYKNLAHAVRVGYQVLDILTKGDLVFPLDDGICQHLINIKQGKFDYESEIKLEIEVLMNEVLMRCSVSNLPNELSEYDKLRLDKFIFAQHYKACQPDFWS